MKRDTLNTSKRHASVLKTTLFAGLLISCVGINADDSRTPMTRLNKLAAKLSAEETTLRNFAQAIDALFADFFDINNDEPFSSHKTNFLDTIEALEKYLKIASIPKPAQSEIEHLVKELKAFMSALETAAQPIFTKIEKGGVASYADIFPLRAPLLKHAHLIPDAYVGIANTATLIKSILHRLSCPENNEPTAKRRKIA